MGDDIHKTHFQVPEMPWHTREKQAIKLLKNIIFMWNSEGDQHKFYSELTLEMFKNRELIDWVMKYKGE